MHIEFWVLLLQKIQHIIHIALLFEMVKLGDLWRQGRKISFKFKNQIFCMPSTYRVMSIISQKKKTGQKVLSPRGTNKKIK